MALYLSGNDISYFHSVPDTDGQDLGADTTMNAWHYRTVDLSQFAGESLGFVRLINTGGAPPGQFDLYFDDISVTSPDGTVLPVFSKTPGVDAQGGVAGHPECVSNLNVVDETSASPAEALSPKDTISYYHGDQIGSARLLTAGGGWAVWSGTYTPFGQEINPAQINPPNSYKFTGKERDEEEGSYLDYFGARYSSAMGRFMSPDWSSAPDAVPYADFTNPQSLNLYSYVDNNPLSYCDPTGHGNDCLTTATADEDGTIVVNVICPQLRPETVDVIQPPPLYISVPSMESQMSMGPLPVVLPELKGPEMPQIGPATNNPKQDYCLRQALTGAARDVLG